MNLKIKTKSKKSKVRHSQIQTPRSARKEMSVKKRERNLFKTQRSEENLSSSRGKSKLRR